jgi:multidrug efflux pump subunit AcrB
MKRWRPDMAANGPTLPISRAMRATPPVWSLAWRFFVFLVLAAQYESLAMPLAIILIVPMCLLAAMLGVNLRGWTTTS